MDVAIVGMGISGLLTALHILYNKHVDQVVIYERRAFNAFPRRHCAGIVSRETLSRLPYANRFVENVFRFLKIRTLKGLNITLVFDKNAIYKIDRVLHEKLLYEVVKERGAEIRFGKRVDKIYTAGNGYIIKGEGFEEGVFNAVVVGEGYPPKLSKEHGLKALFKPLKSVQTDVYLGKKLIEEHMETLFVCLGLGDSGFAWFIPVNDRKAVVGVAVENYAIHHLSTAVKLFEKNLGLDTEKLGDIYGGYVLRGYPVRIVSGRILGIGDAVAMVKSFSGGGLYPISVVAKAYGENLHREVWRSSELSLLLKELKQQYLLQRVVKEVLRLGAPMGRALRGGEVLIEVGSSYYYDHHSRIMVKVLQSLAQGLTTWLKTFTHH